MAALPAVARPGTREAVVVSLVVLAAVAAAWLFDVAVHPERLHDPRHHARFAADVEALPALGAARVRSDAPWLELAAFGRVAGITPEVLGQFRRARYLRATPAEAADALAALRRGEAPTPPPMPDLSRYYRDGSGPYRCDLLLAPGRAPSEVPGEVSGEPAAREAERAERKHVARALILGFSVMAAWLAWRTGLREAQRRLLAALFALVAAGLFGAGVDRWTVAALLLVAGAPKGAPLLLAAPCLLFPSLALRRLGLVLCLGGGLRLLMRRPVLPARPDRRRAARAAGVAAALGVAGWALLQLLPMRVAARPEVAAEPGALFVANDPEGVARGLRGQGFEVVGDERLLPGAPEAAVRRALWPIYTRAKSLASRSEGEARARFLDVSEAAAAVSLTTLPRDLRQRLRTRDGRAVLWLPPDVDRDEATSARLYRARGERQLRADARLAGALVLAAWALVAALQGSARTVLLRAAGVAAAVALLFVAGSVEADMFVPLLPLAAAAPALGPAVALAAASVFLPALFWPAVAVALAAAQGTLRKGPSGS